MLSCLTGGRRAVIRRLGGLSTWITPPGRRHGRSVQLSLFVYCCSSLCISYSSRTYVRISTVHTVLLYCSYEHFFVNIWLLNTLLYANTGCRKYIFCCVYFVKYFPYNRISYSYEHVLFFLTGCISHLIYFTRIFVLFSG